MCTEKRWDNREEEEDHKNIDNELLPVFKCFDVYLGCSWISGKKTPVDVATITEIRIVTVLCEEMASVVNEVQQNKQA